MDAKSTFREKAPWIMALLIRDFSLDIDGAAAILGNLGHESFGLTAFQEISPTVKGSRGGYGWGQWTGPRRHAFEAYCARNDLHPSSDKANYGWLFVELSTSESAAIVHTKKAVGLAAKVQAFEASFERAGVKHYDSREKWAAIALAAYQERAKSGIAMPDWAVTPKIAAAEPVQRAEPAPTPVDPPRPPIVLAPAPAAPAPEIPASRTGLVSLGALAAVIVTYFVHHFGGF